MIPADVSAVVVSHDGFSDVWPGFFGLLFRFWPDLPYPLHLISNHLSFPHKRIIPLRVGDDLSWSETLARGLERILSRFVLLMLEDFFLTAPVDSARVGHLHAAMVAKGAVYLRLVPLPAADVPCPDMPDIGLIAKGAPYRTKVTNGAGQVFTETTTSYTDDADGVAPFFAPPLQVDTSTCDGTMVKAPLDGT